MTHRTSRMHRAAACAAAGFVALGLAGAPLSSASADPPTREDLGSLTVITVLNDLCGFPVTNTSTQTGFVITSADGLTQKYSVVEQDSFSANGKTLDGLPYSFNLFLHFDADGNITSFWATGVTVRVPISQGVTFRAAGRLNFLNATEDFAWEPDFGGSQNHDAFCAALAP